VAHGPAIDYRFRSAAAARMTRCPGGPTMPYAEGRTYYDADSHIMETREWLTSYADPDMRERLRPLDLGTAGRLADRAIAHAADRRLDPKSAAALEDQLMIVKGWEALGAFDPGERSRALDLLGFERQLVFTTFAMSQFFGIFARDQIAPEVMYGGTRAHNRAIADFCSHDRRLLAVGFVPLEVVELAEKAIDEAIKFGCAAIHIPSLPPKEKSPTHPDYDGVWARLQDAHVPFMLHVGGSGLGFPQAFHKNGRPVTDFLGGGENIRSKDFMSIHYGPECFLSALALDGTFEKFPRLRGGCIEQGAMWIVPWLKRLDIAQETFVKTEPALKLPLRASDYIRRQVKFTPFPHEPVGWIIEHAGDELCMFSSDYPHIEGGRNPLKRFEASTAGIGAEAKERFYSRNFAEMMGA
jgi:predicted TIM-barrel fold metal-dependent hydrolase